MSLKNTRPSFLTSKRSGIHNSYIESLANGRRFLCISSGLSGGEWNKPSIISSVRNGIKAAMRARAAPGNDPGPYPRADLATVDGVVGPWPV